ncbi:MAG: histidine ammonia-lyase, partial [Bacteroidetes bacterium]
AQAFDFRKPMKTSPYLQAFLDDFRKVVSFMENDQIMYKAIDAAVAFLQEKDVEL